VYTGFGGETAWKTSRRWDDNIKIDFQKGTCEGTDWIDLVQDLDR
jgi:hypothetical protein